MNIHLTSHETFFCKAEQNCTNNLCRSFPPKKTQKPFQQYSWNSEIPKLVLQSLEPEPFVQIKCTWQLLVLLLLLQRGQQSAVLFSVLFLGCLWSSPMDQQTGKQQAAIFWLPPFTLANTHLEHLLHITLN